MYDKDNLAASCKEETQPITTSDSRLLGARKTYSFLALILILVDASGALASIAIDAAMQRLVTSGLVLGDGTIMWLSTFIPLYIVAFPLGILLFRRLPKAKAIQGSLPVKEFCFYLLACFPLMYLGNAIGTVLSWILSSGSSTNQLMNYVFSTSPLKVVVIVILAPMLEELIFRKMLIDHSVMYGERNAIIVSGLTFGLFHGNLYQFFYAFAIGLVFATVYTRTRKLRYSVCLHSFLNFLGSVVAPWIVSKIDLEGILKMEQRLLNGDIPEDLAELEQIGRSTIPLFVYASILLTLSIIGGILLVRALRKHDAKVAPYQTVQGGINGKDVFLNIGMLLFYISSMIQFSIALFRT